MRHPSKHHRKLKSKGGTDEWHNISIVPENHHRAWHTLFKDRDPEQIAAYINAVWIDPDWKFEPIKIKKEENPKQLKLDL
jgi:hypothetical protein